MKTVFIVNPAAGKGVGADFKEMAKQAARKAGRETEVYFTAHAGDGTRIVREYIEKYEKARFIACGGDGTLNEILNGMAGAEGAEIGVMPFGTGNDYCRNFNGDFRNMEAQLTGACEKVDTILCEIPGHKKIHVLNMCNIGFDCNVAFETEKIRRRGILTGSAAYFAAILVMLIRKKGASLRIEADGETVHEGPLLLTSVANGSFCGGGIKSNPKASVHDGKININIVKDVPRRTFLQLLPSYMDGTFTEKEKAKKIVSSVFCDKVHIKSLEKNSGICIDGENIKADEAVFEIMPSFVPFVVPGRTEKELCGVGY